MYLCDFIYLFIFPLVQFSYETRQEWSFTYHRDLSFTNITCTAVGYKNQTVSKTRQFGDIYCKCPNIGLKPYTICFSAWITFRFIFVYVHRMFIRFCLFFSIWLIFHFKIAYCQRVCTDLEWSQGHIRPRKILFFQSIYTLHLAIYGSKFT